MRNGSVGGEGILHCEVSLPYGAWLDGLSHLGDGMVTGYANSLGGYPLKQSFRPAIKVMTT